ncbi:MAG: tRNA (adenosine(37)-N6)-threonylcarbamoyltransferase complex ATPase subunit type 1 TsaE [Gammaproteobacteria bacterium]
MGQRFLTSVVGDEAALAALARRTAVCWRGVVATQPLTFGLSGSLGAGKTAWVRAMLAGFGYAGRVPSPTYTLMEIYEVSDITLIHLDFYRLNDARELEFLGLRDWQGNDGCWVVAEWPERVPEWLESCDVHLEIAVCGESSRELRWHAGTPLGRACIAALGRAAGADVDGTS